MRGAYFLGADRDAKFEVRQEEVRELKEDEVLIRVRACGICGTDVHIYHGEEGSAAVTPPVILGHEFAGEIAAAGERVGNLKAGDHVTADPNMYCGTCRPCRMGRKQNCKHLRALGVNVNGGFAEYAIAPAAQCFLLNPEVPFEVGAMAEPLACAVHGIDQAGIRPGQTVLVIGGGTIGQIMIQLSRLSGASAVLLSEPVAMRRELGLAVGADAVLDPVHENLSDRIRGLTGNDGADVIIECVGTNAAAEQAVSAAGPGGTIVFFSVPAVGAKLALPMFDVYKKELTIRGSMINPDTHLRAVNLINGGRLEIAKLITHRFGLDQMDEAIHMQMSSESIKVMVHPWGEE